MAQEKRACFSGRINEKGFEGDIRRTPLYSATEQIRIVIFTFISFYKIIIDNYMDL